MKKRRLFLKSMVLCIFLAGVWGFFNSCSQPVGTMEFTAETLRTNARSMEKNTKWAQDLDSSMITNAYTDADGISKSIYITPEIIYASKSPEYSTPVYPYLSGFTYLDTSALTENQKSTLDSFCNAIITKSNADSYMAPSSLYTLVLFRYDISTRKDLVLSEYVLGQPFVTDELIQCPVRFLDNKGRPLDVSIYLNPSSVDKITQIVCELNDAGN